MESLQDLVELCQKDSEFMSFLSDFRDHVTGKFTLLDIFSVNFLFGGQIADCTPSGKYMSNGFLFKLLKLHFSSSRKIVTSLGPSIGSINCNTLIGFRKKTQKVPTFKANFKFISAILNYVLTHSPLDWNGLDFGNTIEADRKFRYTIEKIYLSFDKKVSNRRISLEERNNFLSENFDPSPFFTGYGPIFKKEKLE